MIFNSFLFWLIFPIIFCFFWAIPSRFKTTKKWFLICVSYCLYINWKPAFSLALLFTTLTTFYGAKFISRKRTQKIRKKAAVITVILGSSLLFIFKYYNFINKNISDLLSFIGIRFELPGLNYAIPIGISFFTFQAIGYFIDVYLKRVEVEKSLSNYMLFISFFPQLMSGPISKAFELLPQIKDFKPFNERQAVEGLRFILWGMFFKVAIADRLGLFVDANFVHFDNFSSLSAILAIFLYSFQIYADFAGYSFMAVGISKLLGIDIINNFNQPYLSFSVTDFWRRWHISLSRWLRDYIYIPLGGSRCSPIRNYINIIITFLVSGIWHGANWTFIAWGFLHGIFLTFEKLFNLQKLKSNNTFIKVIRITFTFLLVTVAWVFFRMPNIHDTFRIFKHIYEGHYDLPLLIDHLFYIKFMLPILILRDLYVELFSSKKYWWNNRVTRWLLYFTIFSLTISLGILDNGQFIYLSF